ncbi:cold-shock protein, partial [Aurantiacibacter xanthus]
MGYDRGRRGRGRDKRDNIGGEGFDPFFDGGAPSDGGWRGGDSGSRGGFGGGGDRFGGGNRFDDDRGSRGGG